MTRLYEDLLHPTAAAEAKKHKLKRLVQSPNSQFYDVKCTCNAVTTVFSHASSIILCSACSSVIASPAGGRCNITPGLTFREKTMK